MTHSSPPAQDNQQCGGAGLERGGFGQVQEGTTDSSIFLDGSRHSHVTSQSLSNALRDKM